MQVFDINLDTIHAGLPGGPLDVLDASERERAGRMATALLRHRFVAAHVATRRILGDLLGVDPGSLRFAHSGHGKPRLAHPHGEQLHFNLSHCRGRALLAVADAEVGVDLEGWIERDTVRLATDVLSAGELDGFSAFPPDRQPRELARLWAAKEALLKACGLGLQLAPQDVAIDTKGGWHRLPAPADAAPWWLQRIDIDGPFCAYAASRTGGEAMLRRLG